MGTVLIIEDIAGVRAELTRLLEKAGYRVVTAENGQAGLQSLQRPPLPDLILLDLMMPVMNGWDFRRKQKASPDFSSIPVVLMSAGGNIASSCADLETSDYIAKPVEVEELLNKIQRYCS